MRIRKENKGNYLIDKIALAGYDKGNVFRNNY